MGDFGPLIFFFAKVAAVFVGVVAILTFVIYAVDTPIIIVPVLGMVAFLAHRGYKKGRV